MGSFAKDFNFSSAVVMFSGIAFGPAMGAIVGVLTDLLSYLVRPLGAYFPPFTLTAALIGLIPALFFRNCNAPYRFGRILLAVSVEQLVCSALLNTLWLILLGLPLKVAPFRAAGALIFIPIYALVLKLMLCKPQLVKLLRE